MTEFAVDVLAYCLQLPYVMTLHTWYYLNNESYRTYFWWPRMTMQKAIQLRQILCRVDCDTIKYGEANGFLGLPVIGLFKDNVREPVATISICSCCNSLGFTQ